MIFGILFISALMRLWYMAQPMMLWWDAAMYIGLGKYIYSSGNLGILENFRPVGLSLILGFIWKIGLDPLFWGKVIALVSSLSAIYLVYKIAESIKKGSGIYAATLLSFSAVFFAYTGAPLSDIPSVTLALLSLYLFTHKKYYWSGFIAALAFLTRFPEALLMIALGGSLLILPSLKFKERFQKAFFLTLGFATIALPYFIINFYLYHNPFLPILIGNEVAANSAKFFAAHDYLFYVKGLCIQNPFLLFSLAAFIPFIIKSQKQIRSSIIPTLSIALIFGIYFSINIHQELRYSISFLPFFCILASYGISFALDYIQWKPKQYIAVALMTVCLVFICNKAYELYAPKFRSTPELETFYSYFKDKGTVHIITTSPQMIAYSDIHIVDAFDTWEKANKLITEQKNQIEYVALNDCVMLCDLDETCTPAKTAFYAALQQEQKVLSTTTLGCNLTIYKLNH